MAFQVVTKDANHWSRRFMNNVVSSSAFKLCIQCLFAANNKQNLSYLQSSMVSRKSAPAMREGKQRREKQRVSAFTGMTSLCVTLWGNSLDSGHQRENKLSFTHLHSAGNRADSHVAKLDATGLEKQCSWEMFLIISSSVVSTLWSHFLFPPRCLCLWLFGASGGIYILEMVGRLTTENRNSPKKHVDDLAASTNTRRLNATRLVWPRFLLITDSHWKTLRGSQRPRAASPLLLFDRVLFVWA